MLYATLRPNSLLGCIFIRPFAAASRFLPGIRVGAAVTADSLFEQGFDAVFLGHGAEEGKRLGIPDEELEGVYGSSEFLIRLNVSPNDLPPSLRQRLQVGEQVVVIGGEATSDSGTASPSNTPGGFVLWELRSTQGVSNQ